MVLHACASNADQVLLQHCVSSYLISYAFWQCVGHECCKCMAYIAYADDLFISLAAELQVSTVEAQTAQEQAVQVQM